MAHKCKDAERRKLAEGAIEKGTVTIPEAAAILDISESSIEKMIEEDEIYCIVVEDVRLFTDEILEIVKQCGTGVEYTPKADRKKGFKTVKYFRGIEYHIELLYGNGTGFNPHFTITYESELRSKEENKRIKEELMKDRERDITEIIEWYKGLKEKQKSKQQTKKKPFFHRLFGIK